MDKPLGPIMLGVQGPSLDAEEQELLQHPLVAGVILFTRNYASPEQLTAMTAAIRQKRPSLLIAVDHEGGRVQRFREGFTQLPAPQQLGELYERNPELALQLARQHGWLMAAEVRAVGIDFSFAPVLDLDRGLNTVIGSRAFHADPGIVTILARAYVDGMRAAGMATVGKHFPGHGGVSSDSHAELPVDERDFATIAATDLRPFQQLIDYGLSAVMPAHVIFPRLDDKPAGFSHYWLQQVLRQQLRFGGAIISDDMDMAGAAWAGDPAQRAATALQAGVDLILACNNRQAAVAMLDNVKITDNSASCARLESLRAQRQAPGLATLRTTPDWLKAKQQLTNLCV